MAIDSFRLAAESDKPSFLFWYRNEEYFPRGTRTAAAGWRFVAGVVRCECNVQTALAMSIAIVGAIVIYETFHQDSWWYGSGVAMAWGATVSWVRNLI